jgi:hypothetical protein
MGECENAHNAIAPGTRGGGIEQRAENVNNAPVKIPVKIKEIASSARIFYRAARMRSAASSQQRLPAFVGSE